MDLGHREDFMDLTPNTREIKAKIKEQDYVKLKSFCTAKETTNKTKRQPTTGYYPNMERTHTTQHQTSNPIRKWAEELKVQIDSYRIVMRM